MDFLTQQNKRVGGTIVDPEKAILATGKRVVILGGGDTGADCLGTVHRQKAASVHQFEIMPKPPIDRSPSTPWPLWPLQLRTESAHEEGGIRDWSIATTRFEGDAEGNVKKLHAVRVGPAPDFKPVPGSEFSIDTDLDSASQWDSPVRQKADCLMSWVWRLILAEMFPLMKII